MKKNFFAFATVLFVFMLALSVMVACGDRGDKTQNDAQTDNSRQTDGSRVTDGRQEEPPVTSEIGSTYSHTKTTITFASDEVKATMLDEMGCTEEAFFGLYDQTILDVRFLAGNRATMTYNMGGNGEVLNLYYKAEGGTVTFYDTEEDMQNGKAKADRGVFAAQFRLSEDYKTLQWIADMEGMCNVTLDCTIRK